MIELIGSAATRSRTNWWVVRERWVTPGIKRQMHKTIEMLIDAERLSSLPH